MVSRITELRLTAFKSFRDVKVPLGRTTILTGRNSSGKSNILDALDVLSRTTSPESLADSLDGRRREGGPVRGGAIGCAPHGSTFFEVGCTIKVTSARAPEEIAYEYDIRVSVTPFPHVTREILTGWWTGKSSPKEKRVLVEAEHVAGSTSLSTYLPSSTTGRHNTLDLRADRSALSQLPSSLSAADETETDLLRAQRELSSTLRAFFAFDPSPALMRDWVSARDKRLRRGAENLAPVLRHLKDTDPGRFSRIEDLARMVADCTVDELAFSSTDTGEVMLALRERADNASTSLTTARSMSDGLLRFLAIATALSSTAEDLDLSLPVSGRSSSASAPSPATLLAFEEIENGLHPSQAHRLLALLYGASQEGRVNTMTTTHSPALLDTLSGDQLHDVLVCHHGQVTRLTELPGYARAMSAGRLGEVVSSGALEDASQPRHEEDYSSFLRLIGAEQ